MNDRPGVDIPRPLLAAYVIVGAAMWVGIGYLARRVLRR